MSAGLTVSTSYKGVFLTFNDPVVWTLDNTAHVGGDPVRNVSISSPSIANWLPRLVRTTVLDLEIQLILPNQKNKSPCERLLLGSQDAVLTVLCRFASNTEKSHSAISRCQASRADEKSRNQADTGSMRDERMKTECQMMDDHGEVLEGSSNKGTGA